MQTSLVRRQRRRRLGDRRRPRGSGAATGRGCRRFPSSSSQSCFCWARPVRSRRSPGTRTSRRTSRIRRRRSTSWTSPRSPRVYDRTGKVLLAKLGDDRREVVTFDQIPPALVDATTVRRGQDVLGQLRLRPGGLRLRRHRHRQRQRPGRLHDHPAARARPPAPAQRLRGLGLRAQGEGDHPVDPPDRGVSGCRGQAADHREVPQPELLREPSYGVAAAARATGTRTSRTSRWRRWRSSPRSPSPRPSSTS